MNITLDKIVIENFKGIKSFEAELNGANATISAENGVGKTTAYDAFLWLLFGKNSEEQKAFELRPLDDKNRPIENLVVTVEGVVSFDNIKHTFRKEQVEKITKGKIGYITSCFIDEVPKLVSDYKKFIDAIIPEDTFKLLTNLSYFSTKMHWSDRRKTLLELAGKISKPAGFEELQASLNGRSLDDYKTFLAGQKKLLVKEQAEITPRIDEIQRGLDAYATEGIDVKDVESKRQALTAYGAGVLDRRKELFDSETERQKTVDLINELTIKKIQREGELKNDTSGIKNLLDEKARIETTIASKQQEVNDLKRELLSKNTDLNYTTSELDRFTASVALVADEYRKASADLPANICPVCGQQLPADKVADSKDQQKKILSEITKRGNKIKDDADACKKLMTEHKAKIIKANQALEKAEAELVKSQEKRKIRFIEIDKQIESNETLPPETDKTWKIFSDKINQLKSELSEPLSKQLQGLDLEKARIESDIAKFNNILAQSDQIKKNAERIAELGTKEKEIAQQLADIDSQLNEIQQCKNAEGIAIETAVNGKFKHVTFKLFKELLNGESEDCCDATFNGVPFNDLSTGQQIFVGVDIINVLSAHYGLSVCLFIDHRESITMPIESNSQIIELKAVEGVKELTIETSETRKVVA